MQAFTYGLAALLGVTTLYTGLLPLSASLFVG